MKYLASIALFVFAVAAADPAPVKVGPSPEVL